MIKQDSLEEIMGKFETVKVNSKELRAISVDKDPVTVNWLYPAFNDSVRWVFDGLPTGASSVVIKWDNESPFKNYGAECGGDGSIVLIGTGIKSLGGAYRYSILFLDSEGQVVAGVDPTVVSEPPPPHD
ncbi:MAG: hypothetical protein GY906_09755 [bacterium]|nr:hypothetical protein [bacterium]